MNKALRCPLPHIRSFIVMLFALASFIGVFGIQLINYQNQYTTVTHYWKAGVPERFRKADATCNMKWPDLELFLTMPPDDSGKEKYHDYFLTSLGLFWPWKHVRFVIASDGESNSSEEFAQWAMGLANKMIPGAVTRAVFPRRAFNCSGWHKSQWLKFWASNFTNAEFVGFVDMDTLFVTRVVLNDLFVDGKPIVRPIYGRPRSNYGMFWSQVPYQTFRNTGHKEPFNCMSYFPVIIKTAHLKYFRDQILEHVTPKERTFDDAFRHIVEEGHYSEYNMMCAFMWNHFRDEYFWVINESEVGWNNTGSIYMQIDNLEEGNITKEYMQPRPHVSIHPGHDELLYKNVADTLRRGICFSMTDNQERPAYCSQYPNRNNSVNGFEFQFEVEDFSERPGAFEAHIRRIRENNKCPHEWPPGLYNDTIEDLLSRNV